MTKIKREVYGSESVYTFKDIMIAKQPKDGGNIYFVDDIEYLQDYYWAKVATRLDTALKCYDNDYDPFMEWVTSKGRTMALGLLDELEYVIDQFENSSEVEIVEE